MVSIAHNINRSAYSIIFFIYYLLTVREKQTRGVSRLNSVWVVQMCAVGTREAFCPVRLV